MGSLTPSHSAGALASHVLTHGDHPGRARVRTAVGNGRGLNSRAESRGGPGGKNSNEHLMRRYQEQVDGKALIIFPTSFFLFNVCYWSHYLLNLEQYY